MSEDNLPRQPFQEKAAEAELEGIRRELDETRRRRKQASEAFEAFLRSFGPRTGREPQPIGQRLPEPPPPLTVAPAKPPLQTPAPPAPPPMAAPPVMPAPVAPAAAPTTLSPPPKPTPSPAPLPPPAAASGPTSTPAVFSPSAASSTESAGLPSPSTTAPAASDAQSVWPPREPGAPVPGRADSWIPEPTTPLQIIRDNGEFDSLIPEAPKAGDPGASVPRISTAPVVPAGLGALLRPPRLKRSHIGVVAVGVIVLAAIFLWPRRSDEPEAGPESNPVASAPASAPASPAPAEAQAAAPVAAGVQIELTTLRHVWLRVVVDGERSIEREVDANQRIPVTAKQSIVVRAGDAGALRVNVAGKDETFGAEGLPATRSFTRPR